MAVGIPRPLVDKYASRHVFDGRCKSMFLLSGQASPSTPATIKQAYFKTVLFSRRIFYGIICAMIQLRQQTLILMFGYPGSGKTHFASQFAIKHGLIHISGDRFRYELFDDPQFSDGENQVVERLMDYMLDQAVKTKTSIIYDANNGVRRKRLELISAARKRGITTVMIWTQTDLNTAFTRASTRDKRRPGDKYSFNMDQDTFDYVLGKITAPSYGEDYVVVSGKYDFPAQELTVLKKLEKMKIIEPLEKAPSRFQRSQPNKAARRRSVGGRQQFTP